MIEPGKTGGPGAMGAKILVANLRSRGHDVEHRRCGVANDQIDMFADVIQPDAWFISTIYVRQWIHLRKMFAETIRQPMWRDERSSGAPLIVFGGQTSFAPEPIAAFADVVALGDGEVTGSAIARMIDRGMSREAIMEEVGGGGHRGLWAPGRGPRVLGRAEDRSYSLSVINPGGRGQAIEVARGCRSRCSFCPIGWAGGTYREAPQREVERLVRSMRGRRVNLYAPDYSSVSYVDRLDDLVTSVGCRSAGVDARLDATHRHMARMGGAPAKSWAFGIEGPSERLRRAIGKPLSVAQIVDTMRDLKDVGVRWYMIAGLPGEADSDFDELRDLISAVTSERDRNLEITMTLLQPVPHTPLEGEDARFPARSHERVKGMIEWARSRSGVWIREPKGADLHEHDAGLQRADAGVSRYLAESAGSSPSSGRWRDLVDL